jgi:hypothetical protein
LKGFDGKQTTDNMELIVDKKEEEGFLRMPSTMP